MARARRGTMSTFKAVMRPGTGTVFVTTPPIASTLSPADRGRAGLLYHFTRLQLPGVRLSEPKFVAHLERSYRIFLPKNPEPVTWAAFLEGLYAVDWAVCIGCLEGQNAAWELLFNARSRSLSVRRVRVPSLSPNRRDASR